MPSFDFSCTGCGAERPVSIGSDMAETLALVCVHCGGSMHRAPVLKVAYMGAGRGRDLAASTALAMDTAKSCGHHYACRCSIKLKRPNPFQADIDRSAGKPADR